MNNLVILIFFAEEKHVGCINDYVFFLGWVQGCLSKEIGLNDTAEAPNSSKLNFDNLIWLMLQKSTGKVQEMCVTSSKHNKN